MNFETTNSKPTKTKGVNRNASYSRSVYTVETGIRYNISTKRYYVSKGINGKNVYLGQARSLKAARALRNTK